MTRPALRNMKGTHPAACTTEAGEGVSLSSNTREGT